MGEIELINEVFDQQQTNFDIINSLAEKLDFLDIQILRKFYATGKSFPSDCQPYCFPVLFMEMRNNNKLKIGVEGLRKRVTNLTKLGLLEKIDHSSPTNYTPIRDKVMFIRGIITKFFTINGLNRFL